MYVRRSAPPTRFTALRTRAHTLLLTGHRLARAPATPAARRKLLGARVRLPRARKARMQAGTVSFFQAQTTTVQQKLWSARPSLGKRSHACVCSHCAVNVVLKLSNMRKQSVCMCEKDWRCRKRGSHQGYLAGVTRVWQSESFERIRMLLCFNNPVMFRGDYRAVLFSWCCSLCADCAGVLCAVVQ